MEIFSEEQRQGLRYIEAANFGGYRPTAAQVQEWVFERAPRPGKRGRLLEPAKSPTALSTSLATYFSTVSDEKLAQFMDTFTAFNQLRGLAGALPGMRPVDQDWVGLAGILGGGSPARYAKDTPPETYVEYLMRLSWVAADEDGGLELTGLGEALLRYDAETAAADGEPTVVVLEANDELAYAQLVGHIAASGAAFVIDPYAMGDHVWQLRRHTETTRVLTGPRLKPNQISKLQLALGMPGRDIEVRQAGPGILHDRFIIGDNGVVHQVGASWNGVGKVATTMFRHPAITAEQIVKIAEGWWDEAAVIEPSQPLPEAIPAPAGDEPSDDATDPLPATQAEAEKPPTRRRKPRRGSDPGADEPPPADA